MTRLVKPKKPTPLMRAIRELRYIYRLSQRSFASFAKIPRGRLATIETGWSEPSDQYLAPIAKLANVTVEDLREGIIGVVRCEQCKGTGVCHDKRKKVRRLRDSEHPRTPTIPPADQP